jgi:hypothetical protein
MMATGGGFGYVLKIKVRGRLGGELLVLLRELDPQSVHGSGATSVDTAAVDGDAVDPIFGHLCLTADGAAQGGGVVQLGGG